MRVGERVERIDTEGSTGEGITGESACCPCCKKRGLTGAMCGKYRLFK